MIGFRLFVDCVGIALIGLFLPGAPAELRAAIADWRDFLARRDRV